MDVARLNLSHGTNEEHDARIPPVREARTSGRGVGVLVDLQGPKIRLGTFANGPVVLADGDRFTITTDDVAGDAHDLRTTYQGLPTTSTAGDPILIDDGKVALEVVEVDGRRVDTESWSAAR